MMAGRHGARMRIWRRYWLYFKARWAAVCLLLLAMTMAGLLTAAWSEEGAYDQLARQGGDRLTLYGSALESELARTMDIPRVLAKDPEVAEMLAEAQSPASAEKKLILDRRLNDISGSLHFAAAYILDRQGFAVAASSWSDQRSIIGHQYDFRPYFKDAAAGRIGRYFALGSISREPGYYVAVPVMKSDGILGVAVVKRSLNDLETGWSGGGERVLVTDRYGVIFVTNTQAWRFHGLRPLNAQEQADLLANRQYGESVLPILSVARHNNLTLVDGHPYVMVSRPLPDHQGWTLHVLLDVRDAQSRALVLGLLAASAVALGYFAVYTAWHRRRLQRQHTRSLEQRVAERTAALVQSNARLQSEVIEHERAKEELRAKQNEFVQTAKLAAIGQLSAGIVHEINQPLAAIRAYADNSTVLLDRGQPDTVRDNLGRIADLTERLGSITGQLKQFARKSSGELEPVRLACAVDGALALVANRVQAQGVRVLREGLADDVRVWGNDVRLQQVLVNLFLNALDAMKGKEGGLLSIGADCDPHAVRLQVRDNGPGIAEGTVGRLFDPFFTTKPEGEGLGLGLSISESILRDMAGHLIAANHLEGGAVFTIILRRAEI